jgi:hypothetical protein
MSARSISLDKRGALAYLTLRRPETQNAIEGALLTELADACETIEADENQCRTNTRTLHLDSTGVLAVSDDPAHTIATIGCRDLIVVHTRDVTMVCPTTEAQRVRALAEKADEDLR